VVTLRDVLTVCIVPSDATLDLRALGKHAAMAPVERAERATGYELAPEDLILADAGHGPQAPPRRRRRSLPWLIRRQAALDAKLDGTRRLRRVRLSRQSVVAPRRAPASAGALTGVVAHVDAVATDALRKPG
jgi:hypothetical protein